ncbi:ras and Rab interactor 1-like [Poeciliopsis prolifica]|uniref:ras and Rab interactor 1-like n=1 Tax=Poeciliopsis prolifica TaxID=188132 RepID=UPI00241305EC|nr:ras and Rab interactor 1-like [Poeciliopsis prolifica]XP_054907590.1 ras and Rab interactor 1-like [Poeciliopsis prolifica]XP_054907591.1 ras and Rab interactor 1-like [Poeciliopsis prolifica]XP_054907592.1 ras and Rab interactor 1-like [Poeciliopsis prolifica]
MAQQEEPLYDFPEPTQHSKHKLLGVQRGRGSLRSISVLDRLLLTVPVWLQLSINPANALHILQREPPGTFLVRKSRTSQKNVLCVRLADDSVPSFVQEFGIREEQSTLSLESSAISFPDLPRLISFYCVSRDVLPFPLELPEAIAKASSHKELESISHMGIEFWRSHLNVRGPRDPPKLRKEENPDVATSGPPVLLQTSCAAEPDCVLQLDVGNRLSAAEPHSNGTKSDSNPTLFQEFCPITTRSPRELNCGSGQGVLCFINPLFLQSQNAFSRRRMFKRSLKIRVSTETSSSLSPPLAPPPPPPLMPKTKARCKDLKGGGIKSKGGTLQVEQPPSVDLYVWPEIQEEGQAESEMGHTEADIKQEMALAQLPAIMEHLLDDYMQPCSAVSTHTPSLSPYQSPSVSPRAPPLFPKACHSRSPRYSPSSSPSFSPYQSPSISPKVPLSLSPYDSPSTSPSLSPVTSMNSSSLSEQVCCEEAAPSGSDEQRPAQETEATYTGRDKDDNGEAKDSNEKTENEENNMDVKSAEAEIFNSGNNLEEATETPPQLPQKQSDEQAL